MAVSCEHTPDEPVDLDAVNNRLLRALPPDVRGALAPLLERVELVKSDVLVQAAKPISFMYFVDCGMVSMVKHLRDGRSVEIGAVGIEGVVDPFGLVDAEHAIVESIVQLPGSALRVPRAPLRSIFDASPAARVLSRKYISVAMSQLVQTAACNGLHSLEQRAARWLLIAHDSALADTFALTHEFLAMMLGVHRASVTVAVNALDRRGLVSNGRGRIRVTNRAGLEATACECYRTIRSEIERTFERP